MIKNFYGIFIDLKMADCSICYEKIIRIKVICGCRDRVICGKCFDRWSYDRKDKQIICEICKKNYHIKDVMNDVQNPRTDYGMFDKMTIRTIDCCWKFNKIIMPTKICSIILLACVSLFLMFGCVYDKDPLFHTEYRIKNSNFDLYLMIITLIIDIVYYIIFLNLFALIPVIFIFILKNDFITNLYSAITFFLLSVEFGLVIFIINNLICQIFGIFFMEMFYSHLIFSITSWAVGTTGMVILIIISIVVVMILGSRS